MREIERIWSDALQVISKKISKPAYETWFTNIEIEIDDDVITLKTKNDFSRDWLENRYKSLIFEAIRAVAGQTFEIEFESRERPFRDSVPIESRQYESHNRDEIKMIIEEQSTLLSQHQKKIEDLESRIKYLERINSIEATSFHPEMKDKQKLEEALPLDNFKKMDRKE